MFFDANIQVVDVEIETKEDHVVVHCAVAMALPAGPAGVIPLQVGLMSFPLTREGAILKGQELLDAGNSLEESVPQENPMADFVVAQNMSQVEQTAKQVEQINRAAKGK